MSREPLDDELNTAGADFDVRDILSEYRESAAEESAPPRSSSRASLAALYTEENEETGEESVRIYRPRKEQRRNQERLASLWGETARPAEEDEEEPEEPPQREGMNLFSSAMSMAEGVLNRFRREKPAPRQEELPSFEELLWGKKDGPVRILEEEPEQETSAARKAASAPLPKAAPRKAEPEIHIPEEELEALSVDAILAEYWGGLEDSAEPVKVQPLGKSAGEKPRAESKRGSRSRLEDSQSRPSEKTRLFRQEPREKKRPDPEEKTRVFQFALPEKEEKPAQRPAKRRREASGVPAEPSPRRKDPPPAPSLSEEEALNLSVADILSEFWADYTEAEETPAPAADAPRSRRELSRMREGADTVPPTGAASSAAGSKAEGRTRQTQREAKTSPAGEKRPAAPAQQRRAERSAPETAPVKEPRRKDASRSSAPAGKRPGKKNKRKKSGAKGRDRQMTAPLPLDPVAAETPEESSPAPPPVDPKEASVLFGFLRREERQPEPPAPAKMSAAPAPAAPRTRRGGTRSPRPREIIHEDVEVGAMSVDEILAEYNDIFAALPAAAAAIGAERAAEAESAPPAGEEAVGEAVPAAKETPREAQKPVPPAPRPAEKPRRSGGRVSRMEEEAQDFLQQMRSESFGARKEEPRPQGGLRRSAAAETPAPKAEEEPAPIFPEVVEEPLSASEESVPEEQSSTPAMPSLADADWSSTLRRLLGQDPAPPQPAMEPSDKVQSAIQPERTGRMRAIPSDEVDPRFNLSGTRKSTMVFGDKELDLSADESYVPPKASERVGYHWVAGEEELPRKPLEKKPLFRRAAKEKPPVQEEQDHTEGYDDRTRPEYAPDADYDEDDERDDPGAFPSFGQYLSGLVSRALVRLLGPRRRAESSGTMEDEDEELGPEVSPAAASKYYGSFVTSLRMRVRIALVLLAVMTWISLGLPVTGALRTVPVAAGMLLAIQMTILLLGLDVVTTAAVNLARGRFGADSLALLCCVFTSLDALSVCLGFMGTPHVPLCLISSISFFGVLLSSLASARGLRKALRVPAIGKRCYGVTAEAEVKGSGLTLLKSLRPPKGFVRRTEEAAPDESAFNRLSPLMALVCLALALIVAVAKHAFDEFLYILTVLLCPAVPLSALLCFALPFLFGSLRIFHSGAAIAGWSGISDIGQSENLIVTDRDLFPEGSVEIDTVRIFAEVQAENVISYAGTMICASGSDLAPCFAQLMEKNNCPMRRVDGFEFLPGGGMKGVIDSSVILCGGLDLMRLMNVRVPYRLVSKTTVLLAVDGILCGIFNMKYEGQPQVRKALVGLIRSNRHPIFAIRDFLVTPDMLSECFEVATDGYDFPPYVDRFTISEAKPSADSKLAAVVCREGLGPLVHMADTGRSMYLAVRLNLLLTILAAVLGVAVVFVKLLSAGTVTSLFLFLFLLVWALPVLLISLFLRL